MRTGTLRRSSTPRSPPAHTEVLLDESEQAAIVAEFERAGAASARRWRRRFGAVGVVLASLFAFAALWQTLHPWQLVVHADFYGSLPARAVAAADSATAACLGAASHALLRAAARPDEAAATRNLLAAAAALALCTSAFWGVSWLRLYRTRAAKSADLAHDVLKLLWLPLAPLYVLVCADLERSERSLAVQVRQLRTSQYRFKTL